MVRMERPVCRAELQQLQEINFIAKDVERQTTIAMKCNG